MSDTLTEDDRILLDKLSLCIKEWLRGEVSKEIHSYSDLPTNVLPMRISYDPSLIRLLKERIKKVLLEFKAESNKNQKS